jgi:hypothetical protein
VPKKPEAAQPYSIPQHPEYVRLYFTLTIDIVVPANPYRRAVRGKHDAMTNAEWQEEHGGLLRNPLAEKLSPLGFGVALKKYHRLAGRKVASVSFAVSKLHRFESSDVYTPKKGGFSVKARALSALAKKLRSEIYDALCREHAIRDLRLTFATSRMFVFALHCTGFIEVERKFTREELAQDTVADLVESIYRLLESALPYDVGPVKTLTRRSRNDRYRFEVGFTQYRGFGECSVDGDLSAFDYDAPDDELTGWVEPRDDDLNGCFEDMSAEFSWIVEANMPEGMKLVSQTVAHLDYDDDLWDVDDELVMKRRKS